MAIQLSSLNFIIPILPPKGETGSIEGGMLRRFLLFAAYWFGPAAIRSRQESNDSAVMAESHETLESPAAAGAG
jgi:hypothetical protein